MSVYTDIYTNHMYEPLIHVAPPKNVRKRSTYIFTLTPIHSKHHRTNFTIVSTRKIRFCFGHMLNWKNICLQMFKRIQWSTWLGAQIEKDAFPLHLTLSAVNTASWDIKLGGFRLPNRKTTKSPLWPAKHAQPKSLNYRTKHTWFCTDHNHQSSPSRVQVFFTNGCTAAT